jgi:phospholipase C
MLRADIRSGCPLVARSPWPQAARLRAATGRGRGIQKIRHVIIVMQENRSFDHYFGKYPGADGIPRHVCVPDPVRHVCVRPYHDPSNRNAGGPHEHLDAIRDINGGKMNGFIREARRGLRGGCKKHPGEPLCSKRKAPDVMGYKDAREIPNYWAYARNFVLQDHMFQPDASWSLPDHLFMVSEWSARCTRRGDPMSCVNAIENPLPPPGEPQNPTKRKPEYAWTDLTYLLHKARVSWRYYVFTGTQPDCSEDEMICGTVPQSAHTPGIWNPLPWFTTVRRNHQVRNVQSMRYFFRDARRGTLPAVSWLVPSNEVSDHPPSLVSRGQAYVTSVINAVMRSPNWKSSAIFLAWDDWGGFYDHVAPPSVDQNGYGLRACARHLTLRASGVHRPPDPELRRIRQVHRGHLPRRAAARPADGRAARPAPDGSRERFRPRRPHGRLRLRPEAAAAPHPPASSALRTSSIVSRRRITRASPFVTSTAAGRGTAL